MSREQRSLRFVLALGVVSFFADFTYEGGRSIAGPFLAMLGAGPLLAGIVAGMGEMLGYGVRLLSGSYVDHSRRYWPVMGTGYFLNLLAVPALALVSNPFVAAVLVFAERLGKGIRNPPRDTLLAQAGHDLGHGRAFGIHELLDQAGAFLGPLAVAGLVALGGYRLGFGLLIMPALVALYMLFRAYARGPGPAQGPQPAITGPLPTVYFRYLAFSALTVMGFAHFILVSYHMEITHRISATSIPLLFALAMGADALAAYGVGYLFDRIGLRVLYGVPVLILPTTPLLFLPTSPWLVTLGSILWGAALGVQESAMRAGVAHLSPEAHRGKAYGIFDTVFGAAWMVGSIAMGWLYSQGPLDLVLFASALQLLSLPVLTWALAAASEFTPPRFF